MTSNGIRGYFGAMDDWLQAEWDIPHWLIRSDSEIAAAKIESEIDDYREAIQDLVDNERIEEARELYEEMLSLFDDLTAAQDEVKDAASTHQRPKYY